MINLSAEARDSADGTAIALRVRDHGPGVDAADVGRLFEPFHSTKPQGLGMGLTISRSIVEAHGGRLNLVPCERPGAMFEILLPAGDGDGVVSAGDSVVYVVDDYVSSRQSLEFLVRASGYAVRAFPSSKEFLASARPEIPACLVLDVRMPDITGLELQGELAKLGVQLPIIFITGHGDIPMSVQAMKAGAVEFLTKPFREDNMLRAIALAIDRDRVAHKARLEMAELRRRHARLTPREREVMACVVTGLLNKQVAAELGTAEKTIKAHRAKVMQKMEAASLADLVRMSEKLFADA